MKPKTKNALRLLALTVATTCVLLAIYILFAGVIPDVSGRAAIALTVGVVSFAMGYPNVMKVTTYHCGKCGHLLGDSVTGRCSRCGEMLGKYDSV